MCFAQFFGFISTAPSVGQGDRKWNLKFVLHLCLFGQHISKFVHYSFSWESETPCGGEGAGEMLVSHFEFRPENRIYNCA